MTDLHCTNGDSATALMAEAGIQGVLLPWRDLLHDGPVPGGLNIAALAKQRSTYIAACGWGKQEDIEADFQKRDQHLANWAAFDQIILWFEHDLYDQLQLIQILDRFAEQPESHDRLFIIQTDDYLGHHTPEQIAARLSQKQPVTQAQLQLAQQAWVAFTAPTPLPWHQLLQCDTQALPWLRSAIERMLAQYPSVKNGLNRSESLLLELIQAGHHKPGPLFHAYLEQDTPKFMGDAALWLILQAMNQGKQALIHCADETPFTAPTCYPPDASFKEQQLHLTPLGTLVQAGQADWVALNPLDKWLGGCHLTANNHWRWDGQQLVENGKSLET
ncbi:DUF1835 domain-containing protein [Magnetococcus sp. PR-3]|uniref:DUF1835 domain-containing protein n=1 Tax=Magnetococcus sp. PR-3 TaxID=3120355 RepID=UPI002FCE3CB4